MEVEFDELLEAAKNHSFWLKYLTEAAQPTSRVGVHLAIFSEPFLSKVLSGEKKTESRFSRNRCAPFGEIFDGDVILIKEVGGAICGLALARRVWSYDLNSEPINHIRDRFGESILADENFWSSRADALYATLIELDAIETIGPVRCNKRDRRGWVSLRSRQMSFDFT